MSFLLLLQLYVYEPIEWAALALTIPVFTTVFSIFRRRLVKEGMHVDVAVTTALGWSRWVCPALVLVFYVVTMMWWSDLPKYDSFETAIDQHKPAMADQSGSALVSEALHWLGYFDGVKAYALSNLPSTDALGALLIMVLGTGALLYHACLALSCFRIPRVGFVQARLAPRSPGGVFKVTAISTFATVFIFFPALLNLEAFVSNSPAFRLVREKVEQIGDDYFKLGTRELIGEAHSQALRELGEEVKRVKFAMDATFEQLEDDAVDEFLDWYYSLAGEWVRLFQLAGGTERLEDYLIEKVQETFEQEKWYADINIAFERLLSSDKKVRIAYEQKVRDILGRNRLDWHRAAVDVTLTASLEEVLQLSFQQDLILSARRFLGAGAAGSAVGGGVAAIVAQKITAKLLAKTALKLAAKAPTTALKALLSKMAASAAGGAAVGAAGGSVVPGVGTAVGLVGGAFVGLATGVAIDALLLKLEEVLNRDDFKREIVAAIREARREFEEEYLGGRHSAKAAIP